MNEEDKRLPKRPKLSTLAETTTIAAEIKSQAYQTIDELLKDVDTAASTINQSIQDADANNVGSYVLNKGDFQSLVSTRISTFRRNLSSILRREIIRRPQILDPTLADGITMAEQSSGRADEAQKEEARSGIDSTGRTVLTLFGTASHPRQLFSSLQEPKAAQQYLRLHSGDDDAGVESVIPRPTSVPKYLPLRESTLPNGIFTTKVVPSHSISVSDSKSRVPTLGELFAPPSTVATLNPPRQSRHTATRSQSVNWFNPAEISIPTRTRGKETYTTQALSSGQWLSYNVAQLPIQLSSPEAKRKQRDRALSIGESKSTLSQEVVEAHQQAKEDALFRSVYSSFAPDHDNSAALVPERVKNRLWWKRFGESQIRESLATENNASYEEVFEQMEGYEESDKLSEDRRFKEAVENWTPEEPPSDFKATTGFTDQREGDKDVQDILQEISELLETLNSYQRVRNLSLATNARTSAGQNPQLTAMSGSPSAPSSAEFDTYSILKSQLTLMVATLPPYAVAKLNGEQLDALCISTKIPMEGKNYNGTMEDFEPANKHRPASLNATATASVRTATPNVGASARSGHYQQAINTPSQRVAYTPHTVARATAPSASYPSQQYSARPASSTNHYSSHSSHPTTQQSSSNSNRHSYPNQQYSYQTPQGSHTPITNGHRQFPIQNGLSYSQQYASTQQATSPAPIQGSQYQRPSQPGYQQRAQNSQTYSYGSAPNGRSASPQTPAAGYNASQHRASFSASGQNPNQGQARSQFDQQSSQAAAANAIATPMNSTVGTVGQHLGLTAEEQAMLMNRQRVKLAQQNQMNSIRQGSGTPQPVLGQVGSPNSNSIPASQPNGVTAGHEQ